MITGIGIPSSQSNNPRPMISSWVGCSPQAASPRQRDLAADSSGGGNAIGERLKARDKRPLTERGRHLQPQQPRGVAAEHQLALDVAEPGRALDKPDRVGF